MTLRLARLVVAALVPAPSAAASVAMAKPANAAAPPQYALGSYALRATLALFTSPNGHGGFHRAAFYHTRVTT